MKKAYKIIVVFGFLLIAITVSGVAVLMSLDFNEYKGLIVEKAKEATGRDLTISGDLDLKISLNPSVFVEGVTFSNASWGSSSEMISLDIFAAEVELVPLLSGDIQVKRIVLQGVDLLLETNAGGVGNWVIERHGNNESYEGEGDDEAMLPVVNNVHMADVNLTFKDGLSGKQHVLKIETLDLSADGRTGPLNVAFDAIYNGESFGVHGNLGSIASLSDDTAFPLNLAVESLGVGLDIDGVVNNPRSASNFNIGFDLSADDVAATASRAMVVAGVEGEVPLPATVVVASGALRDIEGGYAIDGLTLKLGDNDLAGNLSIGLNGERPTLNADVSSNRFSLDEILGPQAEEEPLSVEEDDGRVFADTPIALQGLRSIDANLTFSGKSLLANGLTFDNVDAALTLKSGDLLISEFGFDFGGGRIGGDLHLKSSDSPPALAVSVEGKHVDYGRILSEMTDQNALSGILDLSVDVEGTGGSVRALMSGLNGKIRVVSEEGRVDSGALAFLTGPLAGLLGDGSTNDLRCAVVDFDIVNGMASSKATVFETGGLSVVGAGDIDLKEEKLDLYFDPRAKSASVVSVAEVGIIVGGTLKEPSVSPDALDAVAGAASLATGIATGGVSLLVGSLLESAVSAIDDTDYCALALAGKPLEPDETAKSEENATSGDQATQPASQETGEDNPVDGLINNLFGD